MSSLHTLFAEIGSILQDIIQLCQTSYSPFKSKFKACKFNNIRFGYFFQAIHYLKVLQGTLHVLYPQTILVLSQFSHYKGKLYNFKFNYGWKVEETFMNVQSVLESGIALKKSKVPEFGLVHNHVFVWLCTVR